MIPYLHGFPLHPFDVPFQGATQATYSQGAAGALTAVKAGWMAQRTNERELGRPDLGSRLPVLPGSGREEREHALEALGAPGRNLRRSLARGREPCGDDEEGNQKRS